jgi:hypothetical protein
MPNQVSFSSRSYSEFKNFFLIKPSATLDSVSPHAPWDKRVSQHVTGVVKCHAERHVITNNDLRN